MSTWLEEAWDFASQRPGLLQGCPNWRLFMIGKRKTPDKTRSASRLNADLGQKEAEREKTQAELEEVSEVQLSHMEGGKAAKAARQQKAKIR